ncbi:MAG: ribosomal L7Ae/L30e/S12e/Gadd45 family protein [Synergistaceae bacterium]|jgi:ribosomal protein L7Ae-like RNA K-turn-binding protein|nr:ribosomal L7Ae/L30e/S12e/Gadd45 family protein [Synergistaceae bacterium]
MAQADRTLSMLGIARRAGELMIGQDQVLSALKRKKRLLIIRTEDCSQSVIRKIAPSLESGSVSCVAGGVTREDLGRSLGVRGAQIAALFIESGFAVKLSEMLNAGLKSRA